jgi:Ca2+-binding RTX toxin-like protein
MVKNGFASLLQKLRGSRRRRLAHTLNCVQGESLEARRVLTAKITAALGADGVLNVQGTNNNDQITVKQVNGRISVSNAKVLVNGRLENSVPNSLISQIRVNGLNGNDRILLEGKGPGGRQNITLPTVIDGGNGNDTITGGAGADRINGGSGNDILNGGLGNDQLFGGLGNDRLNGSAGDDALEGGAGDDQLIGGAGENRFVFSGNKALGSDTVDASNPTSYDSLDFQGMGTGISVNLTIDYRQNITERLSLTLGSSQTIDAVFGSPHNDFIFGNDLDNHIDGNSGDDFIQGAGGDDELLGQSGFDTLTGDGGNDSLDGGADNDYLYGSDDDDFMDGGAGYDSLHGGSGDDRLRGGDDDDTLDGGQGENDLDGEDGRDAVAYWSEVEGVFVDLSEGIGENSTRTDSLMGIENIYGSSLTDVIFGDENANYIDGGSGADNIMGGDGDDEIWWFQGDQVWGGDGSDVIYWEPNFEQAGSDAFSAVLMDREAADTVRFFTAPESEVVINGIVESDDAEHVSTFELTGRGRLVLDLFSDEFDTQVEIYDAEGRLVAFNDDDALSTNSRLEIDLGIEGQSTSYRIVVKSSSEQPGSGSYQLRMMFNRTTW